ncbi:MAG: T9SS type A sorting domain-containing protein, partial [Saprospiraceae bacterium]
SSEVSNNQQLPYGCQLSDGKTLVAMTTPGFSYIGSVWAINEDKSVAWKFEFPDKNGGQRREIRRLKQLKNGDILGVGQYGDTRNDNPDFLQIPFMFRLTDKGQLLWLKAFYRDVYLSENVLINGHFLDATELENGDILAVGQIGNYLTFDPIIGGPRPDNDILIVRTDANGCINDACLKVTKLEDVISATTNHLSHLPVSYLFPNPSGGHTDIFNPEQVLFIELYDIAGTKVYETYDITNGIQTEGLHGMYLAHIHIKSGEVVRQKVVFY